MLDIRFYNPHGPLSLAGLVEGLDVELPDPKFSDEMISAGAALGKSKPGDICFLANKRRKDQVLTAKATACFVTKPLAAVIGAQHIIPIVTKKPRAHFARSLMKLASVKTLRNTVGDAKIAKSAKIHKSAVIGAGAIIEEAVEVAPYAVIGPGVKIGARSFIGSHTDIQCCVMGSDCKIKAGAAIGGAGFGITADEHGVIDIPHLGRVIIGDRVSIGSQSCVDRGQLEDTILGDDVKLDNFVQIAHNVTVGNGTVMAGHVGISGSCTIGKGVTLGGNVGLADHLTIGDGASVAARAGVMHDIPAGEVWAGIPAIPFREQARLVNATRKLAQKPKRDK